MQINNLANYYKHLTLNKAQGSKISNLKAIDETEDNGNEIQIEAITGIGQDFNQIIQRAHEISVLFNKNCFDPFSGDIPEEIKSSGFISIPSGKETNNVEVIQEILSNSHNNPAIVAIKNNRVVGFGFPFDNLKDLRTREKTKGDSYRSRWGEFAGERIEALINSGKFPTKNNITPTLDNVWIPGHVCVEKELRGKGILKKIQKKQIELLLEKAKQQGCPPVEYLVTSQHIDNIPSKIVSGRMGFCSSYKKDDGSLDRDFMHDIQDQAKTKPVQRHTIRVVAIDTIKEKLGIS